MSDFDIAFPDNRRFDDRQLRIKDDGSDFESFVYESLSFLVDANTLRPGFGRGRDGAIDHMVESVGQRTIIECKFIGRHATSAPQDRWGEVRRCLNDNLPKLAAKDPAERRGSPYAPWLDAEQRIGTYWFCVSFAFAHAQERIDLEKLIANDFLKLSREQPQLSHLAAIHVQVRGWDDFHAELRRRFSLRYRWFGDLPRGIIPLREKRFETQSFKGFLSEKSLPYFSREKFLAEGSGQQITLEKERVSNLTAEGEDEALILTGAGGVGKTRLGFYLCDSLSELGWLALRLTDNVTSTSITDLVRAHAEPAKIALLSDYAERADDLSATVEEIARINEGTAHRVRLIATCRMSSFSSVDDALAPLVFYQNVILGTPNASEPSEIAFTEWVVRQILDHGRIPDSEQVARVCNGLPILAAFALFLHQRDPTRFSEQFGDLTEIRDFRNWVKRRLDVALRVLHSGRDEREVLQHLALLSLRLPMTRREADDLADRSSLDESLLEVLRTDHWIEDGQDGATATHDVFADAMVGYYVFETQAVTHTRLAGLLRRATDQNFLARALLAIDRLVSHPYFETVDGLVIVRALIARAPNVVIAAHERLLRGRLLSYRGKIELLAERPDLYAAVASNRDCEIPMSHLADTLARHRRNDPSAGPSFVEWAAHVIAPLLATSLATPHPSNMLLRRAFALLPDTYRSAVVTRIASEPTAPQTHFLLVAWIHAGRRIDEIASASDIWLSANAARSLKASFIIRAWLKAGGERKLIDRHVLVWIKAFGATEGASFVYPAWLEAGGERKLIDRDALAWIATFGKTKSARFVYRAWLDAGGNPELIDRDVLAWIATFGRTEEARFVYRAWLDAGGKRKRIDCHVLLWLKAFGATTEDASAIYRAWLAAGKQRKCIDRPILAWIDAFGKTEGAGFVYRAWLEAGGNREQIDDNVLTWVEAHGTTEGARYVYDAWLAAGGDFKKISRSCLAWFGKRAAKIEAGFVLKYIARQRDLPPDILHAAIRWCARFAKSEDAVWRVMSLLRSYVSSKVARAIVRAFLACLRFLNLDRLSTRSQESDALKGDEDGSILSFLAVNALGLSLGVAGLEEVDRKKLRTAHAKLLTSSAMYEAALSSRAPRVYPAIIHHVAELIKCGLVDLHRDRVGLVRFANWMRAWPEDARGVLQIAILDLRTVAPSDLWDGIPPPSLAHPWEWKDKWWKQWIDAQDDPDRLIHLADETKRWLGKFDLTQRGWTSIWKTLWQANNETFATRAELAELAEGWLQVVAPDHPLWAWFWLVLWNAAQTDASGANAVRLGFLVTHGRAWLTGEGQRIEWDQVWLSLSSRPELRDEMREIARLRIQSAPAPDSLD